MGWITKLLGFNKKLTLSKDPLDLCGKECWEVSGPKDFPSLFTALISFLPERSILRFEDGSPYGLLNTFLEQKAIQENIYFTEGTSRPPGSIVHIPATESNLIELSDLTENYAEPEVAIHLHVYRNDKVLIDWYDAFNDPMFISKDFPEDQIKAFCDNLEMTYKEHPE